jgi:cGMP-dependent protein kinase
MNLTEEQVKFLEVLRPVLAAMAADFVKEMPGRVDVYGLQWFLEHLHVPLSLSSPILYWLKVPQETHRLRLRSGSTTSKESTKSPAQNDTSDKSDEEEWEAEEEEEASSVAPLPNQNTSPRKSCLRAYPQAASLNASPKVSGDIFAPVAPAAATSTTQQQDGRGALSSTSPPGQYRYLEEKEKEKETSVGAVKLPPSSHDNGTVAADFRRTSILKTRPPPPQDRRVSIMARGSLTTIDHKQTDFNDKTTASPSHSHSHHHHKNHRRSIMISEPLPDVTMAMRIDLLKQVALFKKLNEQDFVALAEKAMIRGFEPDQSLVHAGEEAHDFHVIISGDAQVTQPVPVGTLKVGDSFGEHALVRRHLASSTTISAHPGETRLITLALSEQVFQELNLIEKLKKKSATQMERHRTIMRTDTYASRSMDFLHNFELHNNDLSEEDREFIGQALRENTHMRDWFQLTEKQVNVMTGMMEQKTVPAGTEVITRGERGDTFYIVQEGVLEVLVNSDNSTELTLATRLRCGDSFGELALLYNTPRKATVRALRECSLWYLTRPQFCAVMKLKSDSRIGQYKELICGVPILNDRLNSGEKDMLADTLEEVFMRQEEVVFSQGDPGDNFFIIFEGECEVSINDGQMKIPLKAGDYFGERALLSHDPRAATVTVMSSTATLLSLDSTSFDLILGNAWSDEQRRPTSRPSAGGKIKHARSSIELIRKMMDKKLVSLNRFVNVPLERLVKIGILGQGSYGSVTLRRDVQTGSVYALKAMSRAYIRKEKLKGMIRNEKKTMELLDSPWVVRLLRAYKDSAFYYLLLQPVFGGELFDVFHKTRDFFGSEAHAKFYTACCAHGLAYVHSKRIIYRDLKMENVLLDSNGYALLTDMGCAKVVIGKTYTVCGTADYFAPETLKRIGHNRAVDFWALGVLTFIMMAGRSPFDHDDVLQIYRNINKGFRAETFPKEMVSKAPNAVSLIKALCRKKPEERLGMGQAGLQDFAEKPWYADMPWEKVTAREFAPPHMPPPVDMEEMATRQAIAVGKTEVWIDIDSGNDSGSSESSDDSF